jgi:hypothetical protein
MGDVQSESENLQAPIGPQVTHACRMRRADANDMMTGTGDLPSLPPCTFLRKNPHLWSWMSHGV